MKSAIATGTETPWLVDVRSRTDMAVRVRDYFLRLGVAARLVAPALVELSGSEDEQTLREYMRSWVHTNAVPADLRRPHVAAASPSRPVGGPPPRLGEILRRKGLITDEQIEAGLAESRATGELLGLVLLRRRVIFEDELARTLSEQLGIPYVSIATVGVDRGTARMLPHSVGSRLAAIPVRLKGGAVQVAFADPTDSAAIEGVSAYIPHIQLAVTDLSAIRDAWRHVHPEA